ncbi:uncharacterized protein LOC103514136 [Diaphorina citri]|uniref:Uncharacterized protein LOC103514136 n=1 Tax=Diaphorina citri TaxID=121845 RepID=A0A3Q0J7P8_DIACI|nr:uncharacterized protein LOC103514136 [Diaphorina citri]
MDIMSADENKLPQVGRSMSSESHGVDSSPSMALDSGGPDLQIPNTMMRGDLDNVGTPVECDTLLQTTGLRSGAHTEHDDPAIVHEEGTPVEYPSYQLYKDANTHSATQMAVDLKAIVHEEGTPVEYPSYQLYKDANTHSATQMNVDTITSASSEQQPTELRRVASSQGGTHPPVKRTGAERRRAAKAAGTWVSKGQKKREREARLLTQSGPSTSGTQQPPTLQAEGAGTSDKRACSDVSTSSSADGKKQRLSYSEDTMHQMAVILEGFPENKLSEEDAVSLASQLADMVRPLEDGVGPQMRNWRYKGGAVLLTCVTSSTRTWLEDQTHYQLSSSSVYRDYSISTYNIDDSILKISLLFPTVEESHIRALLMK